MMAKHLYMALLLDEWISQWTDIVDFEVRTVITSAEAVARMAPRL